jgi:hypothetical protein
MSAEAGSQPGSTANVGLWFCCWPEDDDLVLLAIETSTEGEIVVRCLRDVWFHEVSCPQTWGDCRRFDHWRASLDDKRIARLIAQGELKPVAGVDQLPHWEPSPD